MADTVVSFGGWGDGGQRRMGQRRMWHLRKQSDKQLAYWNCCEKNVLPERQSDQQCPASGEVWTEDGEETFQWPNGSLLGVWVSEGDGCGGTDTTGWTSMSRWGGDTAGRVQWEGVRLPGGWLRQCPHLAISSGGDLHVLPRGRSEWPLCHLPSSIQQARNKCYILSSPSSSSLGMQSTVLFLFLWFVSVTVWCCFVDPLSFLCIVSSQHLAACSVIFLLPIILKHFWNMFISVFLSPAGGHLFLAGFSFSFPLHHHLCSLKIKQNFSSRW